MYEELVEALRLCVKYDNAMDALINAGQAADAIEQLSKRVNESIPKSDAETIIAEVAKPRWISVTERLPEKHGYYLATDGKRVFEGIYYPISSWWYNLATKEDQKPTHWMPLPEPPKAEGGNMTTCVSLNCPFIRYCKEYNFTVDRGERCEHMEQIVRKATGFDKQRKKAPKEEKI